MTVETRRGSSKHLDGELLTRTSWVNARTAYKQVVKGKVDGNKCALWVRTHIQSYLYKIGCFIHLHCGKVLFVGLLLLSLCCIGLKTAQLETNVEKLWVEEGGRLQEELEYTVKTVGDGSGITNELVVQTPKSGSNILTQESLKQHLDALIRVAKLEVHLYGITWKMKDLCYVANFPVFDTPYIQNLLEVILPCVIITPLDCFWEGAKVLGPENSLNTLSTLPGLKWVNLNPLKLIQSLNNDYTDANVLEDILIRAGISSAYQEKPCLDPMDPDCPSTAPNKNSKEIPDIGAEITGGCYGFATKFMHWHEDLIVGGVRKNKTGHIVKAEALQSIVQLMGETQLYEYHASSAKVVSIDWTQDKAKVVLQAWQRKFTQVLNGFTNDSMPDNLYAFSGTSLFDIMKEFSNVSIPRVALGYVLMLLYACISLLRWNNAVQSQSGIGIAGVLLVALSVAAGLGICAVLGITFNASTTQIIPFLALGLGVDDMFLIAHTYAENAKNKHITFKEQTGECLKRTGTSVLLTSVSNMLAFFSAAIIPIPALRAFSIQAGILILFNLVSVLLIYPAICSLDLYRRENKRVDVFCCFQSYADSNVVIELQPHGHSISQHAPVERETSPPSYSPPPSYNPPSYSEFLARDMIAQSTPDGDHISTTLAPTEGQFCTRMDSLSTGCPSASSSRQCLTPDDDITCKDHISRAQRECLTTTLSTLAAKYYGPFLQKTYVKVFTVIFFVVIIIVASWGTGQVKDGLDLTDVVPRGTSEYKFLEAQAKYFGFYNMRLVTKDLDYPNNQRLLREYHQAFQGVEQIVKDDNGALLNTFWLDLFRAWLTELQEAFDEEYKNGKITTEGGKKQYNTSDKAVFAYKLLVQTGNVDNPINKEQINRVRLVSEDGIIYPPAFYNYLTAWVSNDAFAYDSSMSDLHPFKNYWYHDKDDYDILIPKAQPLIYAVIPFYLTGLSSNEKILSVVIKIRSLCDSFSERGLPNYPSGVPFTYWEQYIKLRFYLMLALFCILIVTFLILSLVMMNPWLAAVVVVVLGMILLELFGFMGLVGLKLSAIPAVILVMTVGIGVEFTVHISVGFVSAIGSRNKRMLVSLEHTSAPVIHGAISTLLGIIMLVGAEFDFIVRYFFNVLAFLVLIGLLNGLLLLPVLLSIVGPNGEVRPKNNADRIPTPSPDPSPTPKPKKLRPVRTTRSSRRLYPKIPSDISLTTISEEPSQYSSSHEIIVQPEVVVETTTVPTEGGATGGRSRSGSIGGSSCSSRNSSPHASEVSIPTATHVTRVTATATVKVEVHTPLPGSVSDHEHRHKSKKRKVKELIESSSGGSNSDSDSSSRC